MEGSLKDTSYEKRIQRLMTGEDGDQYGFYINITDNIVREVKNPEKACWEDETGRAGGSHALAAKTDLSVHSG